MEASADHPLSHALPYSASGYLYTDRSEKSSIYEFQQFSKDGRGRCGDGGGKAGEVSSLAVLDPFYLALDPPPKQASRPLPLLISEVSCFRINELVIRFEISMMSLGP